MQLTKEDLAALVSGMNLQGAQVNIGAEQVTYSGNIINHAPTPDADTNVKNAITRLMEQTDEAGRPVFQWQNQWYAVFRILVDYHHWPDSMAAFERKINAMQLPLRVPCKEESLKKVSIEPPFSKPFEEWKPKGNPTQYERMNTTAQTFKQLMDE